MSFTDLLCIGPSFTIFVLEGIKCIWLNRMWGFLFDWSCLFLCFCFIMKQVALWTVFKSEATSQEKKQNESIKTQPTDWEKSLRHSQRLTFLVKKR